MQYKIFKIVLLDYFNFKFTISIVVKNFTLQSKTIWKLKSWKYLPHVEVSSLMHFWLTWSKCWPIPHDKSVHLPNGDIESITKHCLYDWHLPSTGSLTLSVQFFIMGLNACRWPVPINGHLFVANIPFKQSLYHSHSPANGRLSPFLHS